MTLAAALASSICSTTWADAPKATQEPGQVARLLKEREKAARLLNDSTSAAYEAATATLQQLIAARHEWMEAEVDLASGDGKIKVMEKHLDLASQLENKIATLNKFGAVGGEVEKLAAARLARLKLEIELERLKASGQVKKQ